MCAQGVYKSHHVYVIVFHTGKMYSIQVQSGDNTQLHNTHKDILQYNTKSKKKYRGWENYNNTEYTGEKDTIRRLYVQYVAPYDGVCR